MLQHHKQRTQSARPVRRQTAKKPPEEETLSLWVRHLAKGGLITVVAALGLTLIASLIAYFAPDPNALIRPLSLIAAALTALIGGFATVRIHRHAALLCGLLNGSVLTALMMLVSLFFTHYSSGYSAGISALLHTAFLLCSVAGACLGLPRAHVRK